MEDPKPTAPAATKGAQYKVAPKFAHLNYIGWVTPEKKLVNLTGKTVTMNVKAAPGNPQEKREVPGATPEEMDLYFRLGNTKVLIRV